MNNCDCDECNKYRESLALGRNQGNALKVRLMPNPDECVRLCEAISAFWGNELQCEAPIYPGAYLTEQDVPIRDLVRAAVGWRKP